MWDPQTNSQWSHILGRAMAGPLRGTDLIQIPSLMTDWQTFAAEHPDGSVLWMSRTAENYEREFYDNPQRFVLGISVAGKSWAWGWDTMMETPVRNVTLADQSAVVTFDKQRTTARIFSRQLGDRTLTFQFDGERMMDKSTGSMWLLTSGIAVDGPLKGKQLRAMPGILSFRKTWMTFHPDSKIQ